ncbi:MAG: DUF1707 SHOCT-like domain-containing protein [Marmoricola sp.]
MGNFWGQFEHDPRFEANAGLRASDRERDLVHQLLADAYADGRLTRDELDERTQRVTTARTLADVPPIVADLVPSNEVETRPESLRSEAERRYRRDRTEAVFALTPALICWIIWAAVLVGGSGTWFPWPAFVTIGCGAPVARLLVNKEDHITSRQHRLEKEQREQLEQAPPRLDGAEPGSED